MCSKSYAIIGPEVLAQSAHSGRRHCFVGNANCDVPLLRPFVPHVFPQTLFNVCTGMSVQFVPVHFLCIFFLGRHTSNTFSSLTKCHFASEFQKPTKELCSSRCFLTVSCIALYRGRVPAANALGCTAAKGLLYKPRS